MGWSVVTFRSGRRIRPSSPHFSPSHGCGRGSDCFAALNAEVLDVLSSTPVRPDSVRLAKTVISTPRSQPGEKCGLERALVSGTESLKPGPGTRQPAERPVRDCPSSATDAARPERTSRASVIGAGTHAKQSSINSMDSRLRGNDGKGARDWRVRRSAMREWRTPMDSRLRGNDGKGARDCASGASFRFPRSHALPTPSVSMASVPLLEWHHYREFSSFPRRRESTTLGNRRLALHLTP